VVLLTALLYSSPCDTGHVIRLTAHSYNLYLGRVKKYYWVNSNDNTYAASPLILSPFTSRMDEISSWCQECSVWQATSCARSMHWEQYPLSTVQRPYQYFSYIWGL